jgi:hypothetical protein
MPVCSQLHSILALPPYKTVILPSVLYGSENSSLYQSEKYRLGVFKNTILRIFGLKNEEVTGL